MTQASKLKTLIRARVVKTGESYTAARRHVLAAHPGPAAKAVPAPAPAARVSGASAKDPRVPRGELSDRAARKSTGHGLDHWFAVLDEFGKSQGHARAADFLYSTHKVPAWHAQMITVTWERARGLRAENQSCTGTFQVSVSRTVNAPVQWVADFVNHAKTRKRWLAATSPALRKAMEDAFANGKSMEVKKPDYARMRYKWRSSIVELRVSGRPGGKSSIVADSGALPDADAVPIRREAFAKALDALRDIAAA